MTFREDLTTALKNMGLDPERYLWPLDAPQKYDPVADTVESYYVAIEAERNRGDARPAIELAVASLGFDDRIHLSLTMGGKTEKFTARKHVAASLIAELARALANSA